MAGHTRMPKVISRLAGKRFGERSVTISEITETYNCSIEFDLGTDPMRRRPPRQVHGSHHFPHIV